MAASAAKRQARSIAIDVPLGLQAKRASERIQHDAVWTRLLRMSRRR